MSREEVDQEDEIPSADHMSDLFDELGQREAAIAEPVTVALSVEEEVAEWISRRLKKDIRHKKKELQCQT